MKNITLYIICLFTFCAASSAYGQDQCNVHLDKSFYVTGEIIWYKLYLPAALKDKSVAIKTTLVAANGSSVDDHFNVTGGDSHVSGYYKLPFDLSSQVYSLVFSATRSKIDAEEILAEIFVPVYNDLESIPTTEMVNQVDISSYNSTLNSSGNLAIEITLDKESYNSREKVNANIKVKNASGSPIAANVSVSVKDAELLPGDMNSTTAFAGNSVNFEFKDDTYMEKMYVKGSYVKDDGELIPNEIIGAYANNENKLYFAVPDRTNGKFHLEFPNYYNSKSIQFFPFVDDGKDLKITLNPVGKPNAKQLSYSQSIIDYIKLSRQRKKLFQRYTALESNIKPKEYETEVVEFKSSKSYDITEYKSFENVASFLKEVSTPLRMKPKKGVYEGAMYMPSKLKGFSQYSESPPIYILNGYLTRNSDYVANLDLDIVTNIAMMYDPKKIRDEYKIFGAAGVAQLKLKSKDIMIPESDKEEIFMISGLLPETAFPTFNPSDINDDQFQPFFRPQLDWNGNLSTDNSGSLDIDFYQSDDISTFVIEVVVQGADGSVSKAQKTYQAVWQ